MVALIYGRCSLSKIQNGLAHEPVEYPPRYRLAMRNYSVQNRKLLDCWIVVLLVPYGCMCACSTEEVEAKTNLRVYTKTD